MPVFSRPKAQPVSDEPMSEQDIVAMMLYGDDYD